MILFLVLLTIVSSYADDDTWTQFQETDDYYMVHHPANGLNYISALNYCNNLGASLASIHSKSENDFIYQLARRGIFNGNNWDEMTLIGLRIDGSKGQWAWNDGTEVDYTNWQKGEPNSHITGEECVVIFTSLKDHFTASSQYHHVYRGEWNDLICNIKFKSIVCKKQIVATTAEPTAVTQLTTVSTTNTTKAIFNTSVASLTNKNLPVASTTVISPRIITTSTAMSEPKTEQLSPANEIEENMIYFNYFYTSVGAVFLAITVVLALVFVVLH